MNKNKFAVEPKAVARGASETPGAVRGRVAECAATREQTFSSPTDTKKASVGAVLSPANGGRQSSLDYRSQLKGLPQMPLLEYGVRWRLIVRKETGQFVLRVFRNNLPTGEVVTAATAQTIIDYLAANWPVGTRVQWLVIPPFRPTRLHETVNGGIHP